VTTLDNGPGDSRPVHSNQSTLHPKLARVVQRHLSSQYLAEVSDHSLSAYKELRKRLDDTGCKLVLDSFCGTGQSTQQLAQRHSNDLVVGIDKSSHRLSRHPFTPTDNYLLLQANCEELWQLLASDGISLQHHYLLYPNPWPKSRHLQRRIHGHASFPLLTALGGSIELRSNWQLYVEEFGSAMHLAGHYGAVKEIDSADTPLTLFEKKYSQSGHRLWAYTCTIAS
jgi:tRNA (guanine-N7-)-methyltransferase